MAAGYATRMYPLTENFPKPLLKVTDKTIVDYLIDDLESIGCIKEYIVVSNHKFIECFKAWVDNSAYKNKITLLDDGSTENENRLGAVKDIAFAIKEKNICDDMLVLAGDNLLDFSLKRFVSFFKEKNKTCVMRYFESDIKKLKKTGVATIDDNYKIVAMIEKPEEPESNWAVPPFYIYSKEDVSKIELGISQGCPTDAPGNFLAWLCNNSEVYAYEMDGKRYDIGSIEGYEKVKDIFKKEA